MSNSTHLLNHGKAMDAIDAQHSECRWLQDENGVWQTACGSAYEIIEGTPRDNRMKFCCYCGHRLRYTSAST